MNFSDLNLQVPSPLQRMSSPLFDDKGLRVFIKRDDMIHSAISGNKWRKLKGNLLKAEANGAKTIITFGGAFSNHLAATAAACRALDLPCVGLVRGEIDVFNPTLFFCSSMGMKLISIPRQQYRDKLCCDQTQMLISAFPNPYVIPEGGTNQEAFMGVGELWHELANQLKSINYIILASGTGGTAAGLLQNLVIPTKVISIPVLKGGFMKDMILKWCKPEMADKLDVIDGYHFGGYAKDDPILDKFIRDFRQRFEIDLDSVYTGKAMYALFDLVKQDYFPSGSNIVFIHTGGLQGMDGKAYMRQKKSENEGIS
ncbi:MAG: pyridoxal-phosphate dependent enzyme [Saprospiraceae bacterium]